MKITESQQTDYISNYMDKIGMHGKPLFFPATQWNKDVFAARLYWLCEREALDKERKDDILFKGELFSKHIRYFNCLYEEHLKEKLIEMFIENNQDFFDKWED